MASEMVERVARAIAEVYAPAVDQRAPYAKVMMVKAAEAAIAAMREPTEAMLAAVKPFPEHLRAGHPDPDDPWHDRMRVATIVDREAARSDWWAMIDEALAD